MRTLSMLTSWDEKGVQDSLKFSLRFSKNAVKVRDNACCLDESCFTLIPRSQVNGMNKIKPRVFLPSLIVLLTCMGWPFRSLAHGVLMDATPIPSFQVQVQYESGEPMANAQITVYAPDDPQTVWSQALTDENGYFLFTPEPGVTGTWDVQARLAGHGEVLRIDVQEDGSVRQLQRVSNAPLQKWLTIAAVVWGFVGTALYFSKQTASVPKSDPSTPASLLDR